MAALSILKKTRQIDEFTEPKTRTREGYPLNHNTHGQRCSREQQPVALALQPAKTRPTMLLMLIVLIIASIYSTGSWSAVSQTRGTDSYGVDRVSLLNDNLTGSERLFRSALVSLRNGKFNEAAVVWQYLARSGNPAAQHLLGTHYLNGWGVDADSATAYAWFIYAARQKLPASEYRIGQVFFKTGDLKETHRWWNKAAEHGHLAAQYNLGLLYLYGVGTDPDYDQAADWLEIAADKGSAGALFYLGMMYLKGQGVSEDRAMADSLIQKSTESGFAIKTSDLDSLKSTFVKPIFAR